MNDDTRRRRRLTPNGPRRSNPDGKGFLPWLYTILAAAAVIAGGWFLGQTLAHAFGPKNEQVAQATPAPAITPLASPAPSPTVAATQASSPTQSPSPSPKPTAKPAATAQPSPTVSPAATPAATLAATQAPVVTPAPAVKAVATNAPRKTQPIAIRTEAPPQAPVRNTQPVARRSEPPPTTASATQSPAAQTVLAYIDALRRGDPQSAALYLGNGSPDESFIDADTRVSNVSTSRNNDGSYKVEVDMKTAGGEYFETFTVASTAGGNRILEKTAIKP